MNHFLDEHQPCESIFCKQPLSWPHPEKTAAIENNFDRKILFEKNIRRKKSTYRWFWSPMPNRRLWGNLKNIILVI